MTQPDQVALHLTLAQADALHAGLTETLSREERTSERDRILTDLERSRLEHVLTALTRLIS